MPGFAETASIMSVFSAGMISPRTASATSDIRGLHVRGVAGRKQSVGNLVGIERDALRNRHPCLRGGICEGFGGVIVRARRCDFGGGQMAGKPVAQGHRSEEHTSELQSLMRISYAVVCLKNKTPHEHPVAT